MLRKMIRGMQCVCMCVWCSVCVFVCGVWACVCLPVIFYAIQICFPIEKFYIYIYIYEKFCVPLCKMLLVLCVGESKKKIPYSHRCCIDCFQVFYIQHLQNTQAEYRTLRQLQNCLFYIWQADSLLERLLTHYYFQYNKSTQLVRLIALLCWR